MSDARLRELERAGAAGDLEAYGRYLQELVRQGGLEEERLELLAYLLWPPAWKALDWEESGYSGAPSEGFRSKLFKRPGQEQLYDVGIRPGLWSKGLSRWGKDTALRAVVAAARFRYPGWEKQYDELAKQWTMPCPKERIRDLLHMVELQILTPGGYPQVFLPEANYRSASQEALEHEGRLLVSTGPICSGFKTLLHEDARFMPLFAGHLGIFCGRSTRYHYLGTALEDCCDACPVEQSGPCKRCSQGWVEHKDRHSDHPFAPATDEASWSRHIARREEAVMAAIRAELVPWILGGSDPVAGRVNERS